MTMKFRSLTCLMSLLLILLCSCTPAQPSVGGEDHYVTVDGADMRFVEQIAIDAFSSASPEGAWLTACASSDRNDCFDAFVLRHESEGEGNTTFTYLIYYPHEGASLSATATLLQDGEDYVLRLSYEEGGTANATLSYVSVTLASDTPPDLSLVADGDELGIISTVTSTPITLP